MATNEIHRYGHWLTVPVPADAEAGDPVVFGEAIPGVVQVAYKPERPEVPGYIALPRIPNGNESGEALDEDLMPEDSVFGSVAFLGVWAFDLGDVTPTIGDPVYFTAGTGTAVGTLGLTAGGADGVYGHVTNMGHDGNVHVRLASVLLPSA
jgi:hypothetical protein